MRERVILSRAHQFWQEKHCYATDRFNFNLTPTHASRSPMHGGARRSNEHLHTAAINQNEPIVQVIEKNCNEHREIDGFWEKWHFRIGVRGLQREGMHAAGLSCCRLTCSIRSHSGEGDFSFSTPRRPLVLFKAAGCRSRIARARRASPGGRRSSIGRARFSWAGSRPVQGARDLHGRAHPTPESAPATAALPLEYSWTPAGPHSGTRCYATGRHLDLHAWATGAELSMSSRA